MLRMRNVLVITCVLLSAAIVGLVAAPASATTVRAFSLRAMTLQAHGIMRGEVIAEEVVYDVGARQVYTHTFVAVSEVLSGDSRPGDVVVVRQLGGVLDGLEQVLVGTAHLGLGEEVVLFARTDGAFHYLIGMAQGAWLVERSGPGAAPTLRRTLAGGLALISHPTPLATPVAANRTTLANLRASVEKLLSERPEVTR